MAARREALNDLGGADELLGPGGRFPSADDLDFEIRFLLAGWTVYETAETSTVRRGFRTGNRAACTRFAIGSESAVASRRQSDCANRRRSFPPWGRRTSETTARTPYPRVPLELSRGRSGAG